MKCFACGTELTPDDIGAYRKFKDREAKAFLCILCFCRKDLQCDEAYLRERIEFLREQGCLLFPKKEKE